MNYNLLPVLIPLFQIHELTEEKWILILLNAINWTMEDFCYVFTPKTGWGIYIILLNIKQPLHMLRTRTWSHKADFWNLPYPVPNLLSHINPGAQILKKKGEIFFISCASMCLDVNRVCNILDSPCAKRTFGFVGICFLEMKWAAWPLPLPHLVHNCPYNILASVNT